MPRSRTAAIEQDQSLSDSLLTACVLADRGIVVCTLQHNDFIIRTIAVSWQVKRFIRNW
jgi:hypothetical protein